MKDIQMAEKVTSALNYLRLQIRTTIRYHYNPSRITKSKMLAMPMLTNWWNDNFFHTLLRKMLKVLGSLENLWHSLIKIQHTFIILRSSTLWYLMKRNKLCDHKRAFTQICTDSILLRKSNNGPNCNVSIHSNTT